MADFGAILYLAPAVFIRAKGGDPGEPVSRLFPGKGGDTPGFWWSMSNSWER